jgi:hypothetical protein
MFLDIRDGLGYGEVVGVGVEGVHDLGKDKGTAAGSREEFVLFRSWPRRGLVLLS